MHYSLDTSVCVEMMRKGESFDALELDLSNCTLSTIVRFELECGIQQAPSGIKAMLTKRLALLLGNVQCIPFDADAALHAADIRAELEKQGTPIGRYDTLIAGHARAQNLTVVTGNRQEFERVPHLKVISI